MIIQIEQGYSPRIKDDVYNVKLDNIKFGQFFVPEKNDNIRFYVEWFSYKDTSKHVAKTINAIFNKPVELHIGEKKQIINGLEDYKKVQDIYVLMHTKRNKYNVQSFLCFNDRIGSVHTNKNNITFNVAYRTLFPEMVPNGAQQLARMYKQDIKMNVMGRSYTVTPKNWFFEIKAMYEDKMLTHYYCEQSVGKYKYTENGVTYYPDPKTSLPTAVKAALLLQHDTDRQVIFVYPDKKYYDTLINLYSRELNRKNRG